MILSIGRENATTLRAHALALALDERDFHDETPLMRAAQGGPGADCLRVMQRLLARGAAVDARSREGATALDLACDGRWTREWARKHGEAGHSAMSEERVLPAMFLLMEGAAVGEELAASAAGLRCLREAGYRPTRTQDGLVVLLVLLGFLFRSTTGRLREAQDKLFSTLCVLPPLAFSGVCVSAVLVQMLVSIDDSHMPSLLLEHNGLLLLTLCMFLPAIAHLAQPASRPQIAPRKRRKHGRKVASEPVARGRERAAASLNAAEHRASVDAAEAFLRSCPLFLAFQLYGMLAVFLGGRLVKTKDDARKVPPALQCVVRCVSRLLSAWKVCLFIFFAMCVATRGKASTANKLRLHNSARVVWLIESASMPSSFLANLAWRYLELAPACTGGLPLAAASLTAVSDTMVWTKAAQGTAVERALPPASAFPAHNCTTLSARRAQV